MKRLNVQYEFPKGEQDHLTYFFPKFRRFIKVLDRHFSTQQIYLLPVYFPDSKNQQ